MSHDIVTLVKIFVSSPGDVARERQVLEEVVQRINATDGHSRGIHLELLKWEQRVIPQVGPSPQAVVSKQIPEYRVYVGIMAARFGTVTADFGSGTEEEFRTALKHWQERGQPWIMFYFKRRALTSDRSGDVEQFLHVCRFREELERKGLVTKYRRVRGSADSFFELVELHLRQLLLRELAAASNFASPGPASGGAVDLQDPRHLIRQEHHR